MEPLWDFFFFCVYVGIRQVSVQGFNGLDGTLIEAERRKRVTKAKERPVENGLLEDQRSEKGRWN